MKKALVTLAATVIGIVWMATYRVHPRPLIGSAVLSNHVTPPSPAASPSPSASPGASPGPSPSPGTSPALPQSAGVSGTFTGPAINVFYGDVQVRITVKGGRITDVQTIQMPYQHSYSQYVSQQVAPMLRSEVISAQSASIDVISGATYTSEGYAQSVSGALSQAHLG